MPTSSSFTEHLLDMLARQWSSIGLAIDSPADVPYVVDPEALISATEDLAELDGRLAEVSRDWTATHARYINEARLRRIRRSNPTVGSREDTAGAGLRAAVARPSTNRGRVRQIDFGGPATLLLRLRGLVGVNARAEILLRLAASRSALTVAELAETCAYSKQNTAEAVAFLVESRACRAALSGNRRVVELVPTLAPGWLRPDGRHPNAPVWSAILPILTQIAGGDAGVPTGGSPGRVSELVARQQLMRSSSSALSRVGWPSASPAEGEGIEHAYHNWLAELAAFMHAGPNG